MATEKTSRQTVDRAHHPTLGEGNAVHGNGPAFFMADSGEALQCDSIGTGGASRERSYLIAKVNGQRVELDTTGRKRGVIHERVERDDGTPGWLVALPDNWDHVFEPDAGPPIHFTAVEFFVGRPSDQNSRSKKTLARVISEPWLTIHARSGMFFCYRRLESK